MKIHEPYEMKNWHTFHGDFFLIEHFIITRWNEIDGRIIEESTINAKPSCRNFQLTAQMCFNPQTEKYSAFQTVEVCTAAQYNWDLYDENNDGNYSS